MLFKIFGKVQNCAKTIVRPNGPKQSLMAGHHPYDYSDSSAPLTSEILFTIGRCVRGLTDFITKSCGK